jgi:glycosyltransferase involved in cell wall biosynthesis
MKRKVLIDGRNLALEKGTGIATYARNLSLAARGIDWGIDVLYGSSAGRRDDPLVREIAFFDPPDPKAPWWSIVPGRFGRLIKAPFGVSGVDIPITGKVIADQYRGRLPCFDKVWNAPDIFQSAFDYHFLSGRLLNVTITDRLDIAHWTSPMPVQLRGAKNVYTLHDLVPLKLPYTTLDDKRTYYKMIKLLLKQADHIVTVSETSKKDIVDFFGYPEEKISNTYQSVDIPSSLLRRNDREIHDDLQGAFGLSHGEYFLFYGAIEPKKNVGRLIEGYLASNIKRKLVIVGAEAWKSEGEVRLLRRERRGGVSKLANPDVAGDRILHFDYAPFSLLVSLIQGARAVVFPSIYEGFGLPVLEAMTVGTPVLSSLTGSIPEIAGDAALLVDPYDIRAIAGGLVALDRQEELLADLRERGLKRSQLFSAEKFQEKLRDVYNCL